MPDDQALVSIQPSAANASDYQRGWVDPTIDFFLNPPDRETEILIMRAFPSGEELRQVNEIADARRQDRRSTTARELNVLANMMQRLGVTHDIIATLKRTAADRRAPAPAPAPAPTPTPTPTP